MQITDIEQEIRTYLLEEFLFGRGEALSDDTPLLGNVIDSQGAIELVSFVQQRFKIEVDDAEVTTENLANMKTLVALVEQKLQSKG